jgi:very-short-patch-repair endonuclease
MRRQINLDGLAPVFRGRDAVRAGALTRGELRGPAVRRLFQGVYSLAGVAQTHALYCTGAGLALPRSGPQRMALDLLLDRPLPDAVADLDAVLRAQLVTLPEMRALVEQRGDRGIVAARRAVQLADPRAESRPESRVRVWLVLDGLHPAPQHWIEDSRGRLARVDLAFIKQRVAVEYDGSWREGELWALNRDRERLNQVQAQGWEVVFVTAALLRDPERMVRTVRATLARRQLAD